MQDRNGRPVLLDATGRIPRARPTLAGAREQAWAAVNGYEDIRRAGLLATALESRDASSVAVSAMATELVTALHAMLRATA